MENNNDFAVSKEEVLEFSRRIRELLAKMPELFNVAPQINTIQGEEMLKD